MQGAGSTGDAYDTFQQVRIDRPKKTACRLGDRLGVPPVSPDPMTTLYTLGLIY
jgi:hypothetical protein